MFFGDKTLSKLSEPRSLYEWLEWLSASVGVSVVILILANLACYYKTLGGYFLADDFVHVAYLKQVFGGHPELLAKNFYSNWLQTEGTVFYRPFISITLALDYLFTGLNPLAFHVSNFIYQCLSTIFLYLIARELLQLFRKHSLLKSDSAHSTLPLITGLVFATHPLHPEVVSWIIARVDSVCCAFYLGAFALFLYSLGNESKRRTLRAISLISFVISLMSKEMAATLPLALTLLLVLFPALIPVEKKRNAIAVFKDAMVTSWPYWAILFVYIIFRGIALGAIAGGYQGSIGEGLSSSTVERIFSLTSASKVVFPLNAEIFIPLKRWVRPLAIVYAVAFVLFAFRFYLSSNRGLILRMVAFALGWFFIVMLPAVPVWNLTEALQGSRFIYLGTAPLCLFIAMFLAPFSDQSSNIKIRHATKAVQAFSSATAIVLIVLFGVVAYKNNSVWAHAGSELKSLRNAIEETVNTIPAGDKIAVFNVPHRYKGAHMLYNAATLSVLLEPPLTPPGIYERVITFEPPMFGDEDLIRISRVRQMLSGNHHFYQWNRKLERLEPVQLSVSEAEVKLDQACTANQPVDIEGRGNFTGTPIGTSTVSGAGHALKDNAVLLSPALDVETSGVDFLDICVRAEQKQAGQANSDPIPLVVQWNSDRSSNFDKDTSLITSVPSDGKTYKLRLHVSEHKKWLEKEKVHRLALWSPTSNCQLKIEGLSLTSGKRSIPNLRAGKTKFSEDSSGIARGGGKKGWFSYDASNVEGAEKVLFEVSQPNAWFEHYTNTYRDRVPCPKALKSWKSDVLTQEDATFPLNDLGGSGFYELRVAATKKNGDIVGYFSDPIMFQLGQ